MCVCACNIFALALLAGPGCTSVLAQEQLLITSDRENERYDGEGITATKEIIRPGESFANAIIILRYVYYPQQHFHFQLPLVKQCT